MLAEILICEAYRGSESKIVDVTRKWRYFSTIHRKSLPELPQIASKSLILLPENASQTYMESKMTPNDEH